MVFSVSLTQRIAVPRKDSEAVTLGRLLRWERRLSRRPLREYLHVDPIGILGVQTGIGVVELSGTALPQIARRRLLVETGDAEREMVNDPGRALRIERNQRAVVAKANNL